MRRRWRFGSAVTALAAVGLALVLALHRLVPGSLGTAIDSGLPWLGLLVPGLLAVAALRRSSRTFVVCLLPAMFWAAMFGPVLVPPSAPGQHDLRVATLNLGAANPSPVLALRAVAAAAPDLLVLQELTPVNLSAARKELKDTYAYHDVTGTVGLWSTLPLTDTDPVDIGIGWTRALRAMVPSPGGPVRVYAAHLASARPAETEERDQTIAALAAAVAADESPRVLVVGDLNTATTDRQFDAFAPLRDTQQEAGQGFGFTWPEAVPVMRPDHILQRGMSTERSWVLRAPGSDHRAVLAELDTA